MVIKVTSGCPGCYTPTSAMPVHKCHGNIGKLTLYGLKMRGMNNPPRLAYNQEISTKWATSGLQGCSAYGVVILLLLYFLNKFAFTLQIRPGFFLGKIQEGGRWKVEDGGRWWKMVEGGGRWKVVEGGRWWKVVEGRR